MEDFVGTLNEMWVHMYEYPTLTAILRGHRNAILGVFKNWLSRFLASTHWILQMRFHTFSSLLAVLSGSLVVVQSAAITCLTTSTTIENLIDCFNAFTVPSNTWDLNGYNTAQPNTNELSAWNTVIASLLTVDGNCGSVSLPSALNGIYTVSLFTESGTGGKSFCVLSESNSVSNHYVRGWGLVAVPATRAAVSRYMHLSAPHPIADSGTPQQAAALFKRTGAKSLVVSGRHRGAYQANSCQGSDYFKTDASHDISELFYEAMKDVRAWQTSNGGCPGASCAFIQMHGKASDTCTSDTTFMSAGLGRGSQCSLDYYNNNNPPVKRIKTELSNVFTTWTNSLPTDSTCSLTATDNVFGRLLNGGTDATVCGTATHCADVTGQFAHIEQSPTARDSSNYDGYATAMNRAISTTCQSGMSMDSTTLLCV